METELFALLMFAATCLVLLAGFPVAFSLAGASLLFALIGAATGHFDFAFVRALPQRVFGTMTNEVLIAVPLFVFMGVMLERSKVAEDLLENVGRLFGSMRGGLAVSVALVGMLLAASTGIVGATVVTMGLMSLPVMLRRGYDPALACGSICSAGTLGQIIPPSIVLVLLGDQISNAYGEAQRSLGNWIIDPVSVGDLFAGALIPGLMLVGLYIGYQLLVAWLKPDAAPALPAREASVSAWGAARALGRALLPPVALMVAVLGSILGGIATPTEAAAVGAVGATLLASLRNAPGWRSALVVRLGVAGLIGLLVLTGLFDLRVARTVIDPVDRIGLGLAGVAGLLLVGGLAVGLWGLFRQAVLEDVMQSTARISSMVFLIIIGATLFALVFRGFGGDDLVHDFLTGLPGGKWGALLVVMLVMFVLGFFLDFVEIVFVVVPIVAPILLMMDIHPVWLGVMMAMNLQTSFLTPPFGFALFYLRGVAPPQVTTMHIYRGVLPFVLIQLVALGIVAAWPALATWLPGVIFPSALR